MNLYQKHRPQTFSAILGNEEVINSLEKLLSNLEKCPHSFLLHGPVGCGKTTIGRIIAKQLNCSDYDFHEINASDYRGVDSAREIIKQSQFHAISGDVKVFLLDEAHELTTIAQNSLLKILEDSPPHAFYILATTEPQKLIPTIRSRCSQFQVKSLTDDEMERLLKRICRKEKQEVDAKVIEQIVMDSFGYPRNAINILEQVLASDPEQQMKVAKQSAELQSESIQLCRALIKQSGWKTVREILNGLKDQDPEGIRRHVLGYCQSVLLKDDELRAGEIMDEMIEPFYNSGFAGLVFACYTIVKMNEK